MGTSLFKKFQFLKKLWLKNEITENLPLFHLVDYFRYVGFVLELPVENRFNSNIAKMIGNCFKIPLFYCIYVVYTVPLITVHKNCSYEKIIVFIILHQ